MKNKYILNGGIAFTEKKDLKKLNDYASKGWTLEKFAFGGVFYKLTKGENKDITYDIDFQLNPDDDYFKIFETAGWEHVTSVGNQIHYFSAAKGNKPIYSANEEQDKYDDFTKSLGKVALYSLISLIIVTILIEITDKYIEFLSFPLLILALLILTVLIFCGMPFIMYKIKGLKKHKVNR